MLNNLLTPKPGDGSYWAGQQQSPNNYYFVDRFGEPALYALIGFLVVFLGIIIIIGIIWLVGLIMRKTNNLEFLTKGKSEKPKKAANLPSNTAQLQTSSDDIPDEVKVAIMAAIMAYYEERQEKCQFTVKRIKRL